MDHQEKKIDSGLWSKLTHIEGKYHDYEYPKVSIILPVYNNSQSISTSLETIIEQEYPDFEVLVIDGGSTDRTIEIVKSYRDERVHIFSVSEYNRYEMLNKGISQSSGLYINFLFPGDFYITNHALKFMMSLALEHSKPHLIFCGTLLRDGKSEVKTLFRHLTLRLLQKGQQPTSLQSCWFKEDTFNEIGKFNTSYTLRGGYELLCRFCLHKNLHVVSTNRVYTDYDLRWVTRSMVVTHFWETLRILYHYFGISVCLRWMFYQKDVSRFGRLWLRSLKVAFFGR